MTTSTRPPADAPGPHPGPAAGAEFPALEFLLVFLVLLIPLHPILNAAKFTIFTARDLDRAQLLAAGHLILFGPEASGGVRKRTAGAGIERRARRQTDCYNWGWLIGMFGG